MGYFSFFAFRESSVLNISVVKLTKASLWERLMWKPLAIEATVTSIMEAVFGMDPPKSLTVRIQKPRRAHQKLQEFTVFCCLSPCTGNTGNNYTGGQLEFDIVSMRINQTYQFNVTAYKDTRVSFTLLDIKIVPGDPPKMAIEWEYFNQNKNSAWAHRIFVLSVIDHDFVFN